MDKNHNIDSVIKLPTSWRIVGFLAKINMEKTLLIYNSLKNDICFVKLNVDEEIKYNELDDKAVMSASKFMLCHISTDPFKSINIVFNLPCGNVLVTHELSDLYDS